MAASGAFSATRLTAASYVALSPEAYSMETASTLSFWPTRSISEPATSAALASRLSSVSLMFTAMAQGFTNFFSCLNITVSAPSFTALSPLPISKDLIGGADASPSVAFASSETSGQAEISTPPWASFIAKARHVGNPHFLQFVFGRSLNI